MNQAKVHKASKAALEFLKVLPKRYQDVRLYNMVLQVCAESRDFDTGMAAVTLADKHRFSIDPKLLTSLLKGNCTYTLLCKTLGWWKTYTVYFNLAVCMSVGNADKAYDIFMDMRRRSMSMDAHVYGALIATFAEAMKREETVVHERKEQFVLLERAFVILKGAEDSGVKLGNIPWNSLLACAGRCGQLKRAFEVLDVMQERGLHPDLVTYGSLLEACVQARRPELAFRIFQRALQEVCCTWCCRVCMHSMHMQHEILWIQSNMCL